MSNQSFSSSMGLSTVTERNDLVAIADARSAGLKLLPDSLRDARPECSPGPDGRRRTGAAQ